MLSFQEMVDKTADQRRDLAKYLGAGYFDPSDCSIFGTPDHSQKPAVIAELREAFRTYSLAEFLAKSGTTGIAGAAYLVPDKLFDTLIFYSKDTDKVPIISAAVAERWEGGDLKVPIVNDETYKAKEFSSGGSIAVETIETMLPTLTPKSFGIPVVITQDLIDDGQWDLVEFHVRQAAKAMGEKATSLALAVLVAASDGWGTVNSGAGDSGETKWMGSGANGISEAIDANLVDAWISNTIITSGEPWTHSISETLPVGSTYMPTKVGFAHCINDIDILLHTSATDLTATRLLTLVFDRNNAMLTGRKRWMRIENYANPIDDLAGAIVTGRQDSVTLYDDAVYKIEEAA